MKVLTIVPSLLLMLSVTAEIRGDTHLARLTLIDGSVLLANIQTPSLQLETLIGPINIPVIAITSAEFTRMAPKSAEDSPSDLPPEIIARLTLTDASILNARIPLSTLSVETLFGPANISVETLKTLDFNSMPQIKTTDSHITPDPRLVYWNTFDSEDNTRIARVMQRPGDWKSGKLVDGKFGKALHTEGQADVYQFSLPPNSLNSKGCIEFWAKIDPEVDSFANGSWLRFFWMEHVRLEYAVNNGKGAGGITSYIANSVAGSSYFGGQHRYSEVLGPNYLDWHHYALVWNEEGVNTGKGNPKQWSAIFIDGMPVSRETNRMDAGDRFTFATNIGMENFFTIAGSAFAPKGWLGRTVPFAIDELKIWNYDKTIF
jgi:hypothetical protein